MACSRLVVIELRKCTEGETPLITHSRLSRRGLLAGAAGLALAAPAAAPARAAGTLSVVDTVSGPNFQAFWSTYLIPKIRKDLGIEIKYAVGSGPTLQLQMQSWRQDEPGFSLLFLKDLDLANMVRAGLKFDPLYPARAAEIPNQAKIAKEYDEIDSGVALHGAGLLFWRAQFGLVHNTAFVKKPPKTWAEFFDRRGEFKGHIGMIRPDASSGGGRAVIYAFLAANGVDFNQPFTAIQPSSAWKNGLAKFTEFSRAFAQPVASSPPVMFHQFQTEQVWLTSYAQDYSIWSAEQGQLPPTTRSTPLDVNIIGSSNSYLAVPAVDSAAQKADAYKVINLLLSDDVQIHMLETMYEYPGTNAWKKAPAAVWQKIAPVDVAQAHGIAMTNLDAITFIQKHGMDYIAS
jgi:putative spermidine/putrescine transport system substrate-binding protein